MRNIYFWTRAKEKTAETLRSQSLGHAYMALRPFSFDGRLPTVCSIKGRLSSGCLVWWLAWRLSRLQPVRTSACRNMLASGADDWVAHEKVVVKGGVSLSGRQSLPHLPSVSVTVPTSSPTSGQLGPLLSAVCASKIFHTSWPVCQGDAQDRKGFSMKVRLGTAVTAEQVLNLGNTRQRRGICAWAVDLRPAPLSLGNHHQLTG